MVETPDGQESLFDQKFREQKFLPAVEELRAYIEHLRFHIATPEDVIRIKQFAEGQSTDLSWLYMLVAIQQEPFYCAVAIHKDIFTPQQAKAVLSLLQHSSDGTDSQRGEVWVRHRSDKQTNGEHQESVIHTSSGPGGMHMPSWI